MLSILPLFPHIDNKQESSVGESPAIHRVLAAATDKGMKVTFLVAGGNLLEEPNAHTRVEWLRRLLQMMTEVVGGGRSVSEADLIRSLWDI